MERRRLILPLPGELVFIVVPAVPPSKRKHFTYDVSPGYPVNMTYDTSDKPIEAIEPRPLWDRP